MNIQGFCSYEGESTLDLNPSKAILIKAPNGSGKSTIFSALVWALYGKSLKGKSEVNTKKKYQTKGYKGTKVDVFFQKDGHTYEVTRCQNYTDNLFDGAKGKDRLLIRKDLELIDIKGKIKLQEYLVDELGLSYSLFMNSIMFGQGIKKLIQESNADKKKLFEEVFDLNWLNIARDITQEHTRNYTSELRDLEYKYESYDKDYKAAKEAYKDMKEKENTFSEDLNSEKVSLINKKGKLKKQLSQYKDDLNKYPDNLSQVRDSKEKELKHINSKIVEARTISSKPLSEVISHTIKLLEKGKHNKALNELKLIQKSFIDLDSLDHTKDNVLEEISKITNSLSKVKNLKRLCTDIQEDIKEIYDKIDKLKSKKLSIVSPKYKKKYTTYRSKRNRLQLRMQDVKSSLENYQWLLEDPLSNRGIKAFLFDSSLDLLNNTLERYSQILGFRISFKVDMDSTKKDFITSIEMDGESYDYEELSGGQQQLVNVAMAFAMNESLTASKDINISFLDEVFESLSQDNIDIVISLIQSLFEDKVLFLITHHESLPLSNFKTLVVERAHGRSSFKLL